MTIASKIDKFLETDNNRLDWEVSVHPTRFNEVAVALADARLVVDKAKTMVEVAKEDLKQVDAKLSLDIRANPEKFGLAKATEASIEAAVLVHAEHDHYFKRLINTKEDLANAEHACGILEAAKEAMSEKGRLSLGKGVDLLLSNIRSTPRQDTYRESARMPVGEQRRPD